MNFIFELLHAFGAGIAFFFGVLVGAVLMDFHSRKAGKEAMKAHRAHCAAVEERLGKYVVHTSRIADALEKAVNAQKP